MEVECPEKDDEASGELLKMVDWISSDEIELLTVDTLLSAQGIAEVPYGEFRFGTSLIGSMGPYLFIQYTMELQACSDKDPTLYEGFVVFDMEQEKEVQILSPEERSRILETEQIQAFEKMHGDPVMEVEKSEQLTLSGVKPVLFPGIGLVVYYQFTADTSFSDARNNRSSYTRSVEIPAQVLPELLTPYAHLPPVMHALSVLGDEVQVGGWTPVFGTPEQIETLIQVLAGSAPDLEEP